MITFIIAFSIVSLISGVILIVIAHLAPNGWQDCDGFHYGKPPADTPTCESCNEKICR